MNYYSTPNDAIRVIDLARKDLKEIVSEVVREEIEALKSFLNYPSIVDKEYLSRKQAAQKLHVSLPTLRAWTKTGRIKSYAIGRRVLYKPEDIENALREQPKYVRK